MYCHNYCNPVFSPKSNGFDSFLYRATKLGSFYLLKVNSYLLWEKCVIPCYIKQYLLGNVTPACF